MENKYILASIFDARKSFYNKAYFTREDTETEAPEKKTILKLYSYDTLVLTLLKLKDVFSYKLNHDIEEKKLLSNTTKRHINEFLRQETTRQDLKGKKALLENENKNLLYYIGANTEER